MSRYEKLFTSLKYFLIGRRYSLALKALQFARNYHSGTRKDGKTPEFLHQLEIAHYLTTLKDVKEEETLITVALLHDVMEDYDISKEEMVSKFGDDVSTKVWLLTKKHNGTKKDSKVYFDSLSEDNIASIVKGADRIHNVNSMAGVFSKEKQLSYVDEVEVFFLPMIKKAKYKFPEQGSAYYNLQFILESQVAFVRNMHKK